MKLGALFTIALSMLYSQPQVMCFAASMRKASTPCCASASSDALR
jgi:hypothetical protein